MAHKSYNKPRNSWRAREVSLRSYLISILLLLSCSTKSYVSQLNQDLYSIDLYNGTRWLYVDMSDISSTKYDTCTVWVQNRTWSLYKTVKFYYYSLSPPGRYSYKANIIGSPYYIKSKGAKISIHGYLHDITGLYANTNIGFVRLDGRTNPSGLIIVPSCDSPLSSFSYGDGYRKVVNWDTLITVPAGTFRCIMIEDLGIYFRHYLEFWANGIGLIRHLDLYSTDADWRLVKYVSPDSMVHGGL